MIQKGLLLALVAIFVTSSSVNAIALDATSVNTNAAVDLRLREVQPDPIGDEVGGDGEDIGVPSTGSTGDGHKGEIDLEAWSATDDDRIDDPESDDSSAFGVEREMKESGEKGGTADMNIGVGELQEGDTPELTVDDGTSEMNKAELIDAMATESDSGEHDIDDDSDGNAAKTVHLILSGDTQGEIPEGIPGVEEPDFGFVSNGKVYVRAGYVKLGDIKGESSDESAAGGNAETTWKVEKGEKAAAKKPKEIVVVGSKVRGWDPEKKEEILGTASDPKKVVTEEGLEIFTQRLVLENESVKSLVVQNNQTDLEFVSRFHLFGFIPMSITNKASISTDPESLGRVKVKLPWWSILGRKTVRPHDFQTSLEEAINDVEISQWKPGTIDEESGQLTFGDGEHGSADTVPVEDVTLNFAQIKAMLHDTAMAIIRKIG